MTTYQNSGAAEGGAGVTDRLTAVGQDLKLRARDAGSRLHDEFGRLGETTTKIARSSRRSAGVAGKRVAATVRQRPLSFGLAAVLSVAAVALLANPRTRRMAVAGGPWLWNEFQKRRGSLHL